MDHGLTGQNGVPVKLTAQSQGTEPAQIPLLCLVEQTAIEIILIFRIYHVMEMIAAQVKNILNILAQNFFILTYIVDTSNYVGCYHRNDSGLIHKIVDSNDSSPCWCIGYCASHNYSLAGIKKYSLQNQL